MRGKSRRRRVPSHARHEVESDGAPAFMSSEESCADAADGGDTPRFALLRRDAAGSDVFQQWRVRVRVLITPG